MVYGVDFGPTLVPIPADITDRCLRQIDSERSMNWGFSDSPPRMNEFSFSISSQPDDSTCGPTCLQAVYEFFGDDISLDDVVSQTGRLDDGGTLAVFLGCHALKRGYRARIYTYNLQIFDPTWFQNGNIDLEDKLMQQIQIKKSPKLQAASESYIEFLRLGGDIRMQVLSAQLIRKYLKRRCPILTGLSATFLYGESRERLLTEPIDGKSTVPDDVGGLPSGHFVVLCGFDPVRNTVLVADPLDLNPIARDRKYAIDLDRVFSAILLGIVTFDANLLVVRPRKDKEKNKDASTHRE